MSEQTAFCVDLDGTLLKSDLLYESLLGLIARNPFYVFLLPVWLLRGKAALKREIARRVELDVTTLPYDARVLEALRQAPGRPRVLCTASDSKFAGHIADHLGLFEIVLASDGTRNLNGIDKAEELARRFGEGGVRLPRQPQRRSGGLEARATRVGRQRPRAASRGRGPRLQGRKAPQDGALRVARLDLRHALPPVAQEPARVPAPAGLASLPGG